MQVLLFLWVGLLLGVAPGFSFALGAETSYREPALQENFYGAVVRGQRCWIVGYYGAVLHSADQGATWEIQPSGTRRALFRATFVTDEKGWIVGSYGTVLHTQNAGKSWLLQRSGSQEHLLGVDFISEREGWAVGSRGTILYTNDGGASWMDRSLKEDVILNSVSFVTPRRGWVAGEFGVIYHTRDGGKNWLKQKSPIEVSFESGQSRNLFQLLFPAANAGWAFGLDGVILKTRNGERWEVASSDGASPNPLPAHHLFAAAQFNGKLWAVGERGTVLESEMGKENWRRAEFPFPPVTLNGIGFSAVGFGLVVGNRGLVFRTLDGGRQWVRIRIVPQGQGKGISHVR